MSRKVASECRMAAIERVVLQRLRDIGRIGTGSFPLSKFGYGAAVAVTRLSQRGIVRVEHRIRYEAHVPQQYTWAAVLTDLGRATVGAA